MSLASRPIGRVLGRVIIGRRHYMPSLPALEAGRQIASKDVGQTITWWAGNTNAAGSLFILMANTIRMDIVYPDDDIWLETNLSVAISFRAIKA